ncbi:hypothetical protein D5H75_18680 [Bailinhaonella thermotolerans]|uniref:Uncharacterized protein n=1 Tax=Bailinhaonella thermotolerans TaxID=1070861 RepID=A0A3A4BC22_9ACTN|nr:hypothetical protein D5H75_18680 [Bailinhaonella thermotolerans]
MPSGGGSLLSRLGSGPPYGAASAGAGAGSWGWADGCAPGGGVPGVPVPGVVEFGCMAVLVFLLMLRLCPILAHPTIFDILNN